MHSHHSHSGEFCRHASSTLDQVLARAYELGFTHFHLSEHVPRWRDAHLYPEEREAGMTPDSLTSQFQAYLVKARTLQRMYENMPRPMHVLVGCETEHIESPHSLDALARLLESNTQLSSSSPTQLLPPPPCIGRGLVDYIVGSVHHIRGVPIDFDRPTYEMALKSGQHDQKRHLTMLQAYLDAQFEVMDRLRPEVIGHFDLYRLFEPYASWYPDSSTPDGRAIHAKLKRNIHFAASYGALFEVNSAAFRKGWTDETYPGRHVLRMITKACGRLALSDDSHGTKQVGLNFARLREYLLNEGISEVWYLTPSKAPENGPATSVDNIHLNYESAERARKTREQSMTPGTGAPTTFLRGTQAHCIEDWHKSPFWSTLPQDLLT